MDNDFEGRIRASLHDRAHAGEQPDPGNFLDRANMRGANYQRRQRILYAVLTVAAAALLAAMVTLALKG